MDLTCGFCSVVDRFQKDEEEEEEEEKVGEEDGEEGEGKGT